MKHQESQLLKDVNEAYREIARLGGEINKLREERDRMQSELFEQLKLLSLGGDREWKLVSKLSKSEQSARNWEECATQFFLCAGKDKTASWDQFEKAAVTFQYLKDKQR